MTLIKSTFNANADGWSIVGDAQTFEWLPTGGDKGGHLHWVDAASGDGAFWRAPAKFLGDLGAFFNGRMSFAWWASGNDLPGSDIAITGANGHTLIGDVGDPGVDWTRETIKLGVAGQWRLDAPDGALATARDIKAVLADVTQILIRAEHVYGNEDGGLDSVVLRSREVPATAFGEDRPVVGHDGPGDMHHALAGAHVMLV